MMDQSAEPDACHAVVADVGRSALRLGMTDSAGRLREDTVRTYDPIQQPTVSGAISAFSRDLGLAALPKRLGIAVSGAPRGDTITVTNGRWRISRSGLTAMLQHPPLILNDFAANAWAISGLGGQDNFERLAGASLDMAAPGVYCVIGIGSGLGVALLSRHEYGAVNIIATEAGHTSFPTGLPAADEALAAITKRSGFATTEMLVSAPGLVALYSALAGRGALDPKLHDPHEVLRLGLQARDPVAAHALTVFGMAFWHFAANVALTHGAWDGIIVTGGLATALRPVLQRQEVADKFALRGPFQRQLESVPRALTSSPHAELRGTALALLANDAHRSFQRHALAA